MELRRLRREGFSSRAVCSSTADLSDAVPGSHFLQLPLLKENCLPVLSPTERVQHPISGILWRFSTWVRRKSLGPGCSVAEHSTYMCEANRFQPPHHRGRRKGSSGTWGGKRQGKRQRRRAPKTKKTEKKSTMWLL